MSTEDPSMYMLRMAYPDATPEQLAAGVLVFEETTLAEVRAGQPVSQEMIDEAARRLKEIFP